MPMSQAVRLCPQLVIVKLDMKKYKEVSHRIFSIFREYTNLVEPLSLDEAFLDVSECTIAQGSATLIAESLRERVRKEVGITVSAGIAPNKFLAKIASDWNKPDGQLTIAPEAVADFVYELPVEKIFGVGSVTAQKLQTMGAQTCGDLQKFDLLFLTKRFGRFGTRLFHLCRGEDDRPVRIDRSRKSLSTETTFNQDLPTLEACMAALPPLVEDLQRRLSLSGHASAVKSRTLKLRFTGFETTTISRSGVGIDARFFESVLEEAWQRGRRPVRLIGVGVALETDRNDHQIDLF